MEKSSMNNEQLKNILGAVSGKLGVTPEELQSALKSGKLEAATKNMDKKQQQKLASLMNDKSKLEKLINSPQAKLLYEKLMGKKL